MDPETFRRLRGIADDAAWAMLSTSATHNIADAVSSQAVLEYWQAVQRGVKVLNDEAFVRVIAKRRAIDAMRVWRRHRDLRYGHDDDDHDPMLVAEDLLPTESTFAPRLNQVEFLLSHALSDDIDAEIARTVWISGSSPAVAALKVGLAEGTVRNRMTHIRQRFELWAEEQMTDE